MLYVANVSEDEVADADENEYVKQVREYAEKRRLKLLQFVRKLKKKLLNLMTRKRKCSLKNWALKNPDLTN